MRILVIGAGPTGLGAATRLAELGHEDFVVLERERHAGGHSASFVTAEGFTFDMGGHVTFSRDRRFLAVVERALRGRFLTHERRARIYTHDRFIPYPFQNNIASLPPQVAWECLQGLLAVRAEGRVAANFEQHMRAAFGDGITRHFMLPYNRKVWAHEPSAMGTGWMADRVSHVSIEDALRPFVFGPDSSWGPNAEFRYPEQGTGAIYRSLAAALPEGRLRFGVRVEAVDARRRRVRVGSGEWLRYDALVSSMPLPELVKKLVAVPARMARLAARLVHNQGLFVGVGVRGEIPFDHHWTYFPERRFPFYRVTILSHYSPRLVPTPGHASLLCEVSIPAGRRIARAALTRRVVAALGETPLLAGRAKRDVVCVWSCTAPYSYPIPTLDRDDACATLLSYLDGLGIHSRGRFGAFTYERGNMDHSFLAGLDTASALVGRG